MSTRKTFSTRNDQHAYRICTGLGEKFPPNTFHVRPIDRKNGTVYHVNLVNFGNFSPDARVRLDRLILVERMRDFAEGFGAGLEAALAVQAEKGGAA